GFQDFTGTPKQQGGSTGTSPTSSSAGTPSPSGPAHLLSPAGPAHLLSPSGPAHLLPLLLPTRFPPLPGGFGVGCRESPLCGMSLSEYSACARGPAPRLGHAPSHAPGHALPGYSGLTDASYARRQTGGTAPPPNSYLPQRTSSLVATAMQAPCVANSAGCKMDACGGQLGSYPASQLHYMMQAGWG
ncbi:hypothetical protein ANANG_G00053110, partial [Anguilla anguilla]